MMRYLATPAVFALLGLASCYAAGKLLETRRASELAFAREMSAATGPSREAWEDAVEAMARRGELDDEMRGIAEAGGVSVPEEGAAAMPAHWDFRGHAAAKAAVAAVLAAMGAVVAAAFDPVGPLGIMYVAWAACGAACAVVIGVADVRAGIVPWEPLVVAAVWGVAYAIADGRVGSLAPTAAIAAATYLAFKAVSKLGPAGCLGNGDVRAACACVLFLGSGTVAVTSPLLCGILAGCAAGFATLVALAAAGKKEPGAPVRLGPFFSACMAFGALAPAVSALAA